MKCNNVTQKCNSQHRRVSEKEFRKIGKWINMQGNDFCYKDFPMSECAFRQRIFRLRDEIVLTTGGRPCFYRFKGEYTGFEKGNVTLEGMGVGKEFEEFLRDVQIQYPQIHDLKIKFHSTQAHQYLKNVHGWKFDPTNKRLSITRMPLTRWTWVNISVYPKTVLIDLGCTSQPVIYDSRGAIRLVMILEHIRQFLIIKSKGMIEDIPDPTEWIVTQYHLNKDGFTEYSGEKFNVTVEDLAGGFMRFYSKTFPDNRTRVRLEQIKTPKCSVKEEIFKMAQAELGECIPQIGQIQTK